MPVGSIPKNALSFGAGALLYAPLGTTLPTNTVAGSVFTDNWPAGWVLLGVTREGHELSYELDTDTVEAAEYLDPLATVTTGRSSGMSFDLMQIHATNLKRALNGGTLTTSGSGATQLNTLKPPQIGQEVRCMIGWESTDVTERIVAQQAFQVGSLSIARRKGADNASLPVEFKFEPDANGDPFTYWSAGALRG
ncbi:hypothetical protein ABZ949_02300 [Micromonospora tulbaghiae]|uniref:phage tail tube protein n=1 Tax=Micromonospora tulbaghiae TaxID=479978 RepID=UPI003407A4E4